MDWTEDIYIACSSDMICVQNRIQIVALALLLTVQSNTKERETFIETALESVSLLLSVIRGDMMECLSLRYAIIVASSSSHSKLSIFHMRTWEWPGCKAPKNML